MPPGSRSSIDAPPSALVCDRRIKETVAEHDCPFGKSRRHYFANELGARCGEQQHLGVRVDRHRRIEQKPADGLGELRAARLAQQYRRVRRSGKAVLDALDLGRLPTPIDAFKGYEQHVWGNPG